jgi:hypothetical protein
VRILLIIITGFFFWSHSEAAVETWYLDDILAQGTNDELADMPKLLHDFDTKYVKSPISNRMVMKVIRISHGSLYERIGMKVGDLIENGSARDAKFAIKPGTLLTTPNTKK